MRLARFLLTFAVLALSWPAQAQAQPFPNIPANTFLGRLGAGQAGQPQAIPFQNFPFGQIAPFSINPPNGSTTQGLTVTQSLPASGTQPTGTPFDFNKISATNPGYSVPIGGSADPIFGIVPHVSAFTAYMNVSGPSSGNDNNGLWGAIAETATVGFIKGITGSAYSNINSGDQIYGVAGGALTGASANVQYAVGVLSESISKPGGAITYRFGFLTSGGSASNVQGTSADAAYAIETMAAAPFENGFLIFTHNGAGSGLATNGNIISSDGSFTTGSLINLPSATFTTDIFNLASFHVNGSGIFLTPIIETLNANATTSITINNNSTGNSAFSVLATFNSANFADFGIGSTGLTGSSSILANKAIVQASAGSAGIAINNQGANPIVIGVSNAEVARFNGATPGQLTLGVAGTTVGKLAFANATSGGITIGPPTGALGSAVLTLPDVTDTVAVIGTAQTFSALQIFSVGLQTGTTTVSGLPTCNSGAKGQRYFVTDANAATYHTTAAGGGSNNVGVICDGTNWYISANDNWPLLAKAA